MNLKAGTAELTDSGVSSLSAKIGQRLHLSDLIYLNLIKPHRNIYTRCDVDST